MKFKISNLFLFLKLKQPKTLKNTHFLLIPAGLAVNLDFISLVPLR